MPSVLFLVPSSSENYIVFFIQLVNQCYALYDRWRSTPIVVKLPRRCAPRQCHSCRFSALPKINGSQINDCRVSTAVRVQRSCPIKTLRRGESFLSHIMRTVSYDVGFNQTRVETSASRMLRYRSTAVLTLTANFTSSPDRPIRKLS